ncbi:lipid-binding SYLF domain-containing protein [Massilia sp. G4R7]|uniref:Lipid-binding SYLF domain-containing protein n=1 Tax=Massilia phyllostachyos TaxID=2898585 RepID=A0ABS8Q566_9BURK|nr:lipid-binding SYLF domain-containing protein [Massilia phyllostachyos]MCD2516202.1 lipid-binding SYLF domain-containing protein [Massilia phyllostachyos]
MIDTKVHTAGGAILGRVIRRRALCCGAAALLLAALPAGAAQDGRAGAQATPAAGQDGTTEAQRKDAAGRRLDDAAAVVRTMSATPALAELLRMARGVYIVPLYGRAALGVGAAGGSGVLLTRHADSHWGNPAFFTIGGLSVGLQAGVESGPIALLLMNQKAVEHFRKRNNFSLSADAGLTVVNFARMKQGSTAGDVVAWSGAKGLFGNAATVALNDIRYNERLTHAHYGKPVTAQQAIDSSAPDPRAEALRAALGAGAGGSTTASD